MMSSVNFLKYSHDGFPARRKDLLGPAAKFCILECTCCHIVVLKQSLNFKVVHISSEILDNFCEFSCSCCLELLLSMQKTLPFARHFTYTILHCMHATVYQRVHLPVSRLQADARACWQLRDGVLKPRPPRSRQDHGTGDRSGFLCPRGQGHFDWNEGSNRPADLPAMPPLPRYPPLRHLNPDHK